MNAEASKSDGSTAQKASTKRDPKRKDFWERIQGLWHSLPKTSLFFFFAVLPASLWWWYYLGLCKSQAELCQGRRMMLVALSLASFMVGCLAGFVFTSYGEETGTVGKIRDWLIGGITGVTFVELFKGDGGVFGSLLHRFTVPPGSDNDFALTVSVAVVYLSLGFLFMFFQRELILNVVLAKSRAERGELDGTRQTGLAIQKLLAQLPPSILAGVTDIGETDRVSKDEVQELSNTLYSDDVSTFLKQAENAAKNGVPLEWDTVYKVANVQYYRSYFAPDNQKSSQVRKALEWIRRALAMNPLHADLTMKCADMLGADGQSDAAIAVLEALRVRPEAPAVVEQWLGYYLRSIPSRADEAIKHSNRFLSFFPDDPDTAFNLAYAYGVKYCAAMKSGSQADAAAIESRNSVLRFLDKGLNAYPEFGAKVAQWRSQDRGLACFSEDADFKKLLEQAAERSKGMANTIPNA
jgi:tetratricopeptide (TPR) repeat protein